MPIERATAAEAAAIQVVPEMSKSEVIDFARRHDVAVWEGRATISKYWADDDTSRATPYEVVETDPNILTTAGVSLLWNLASAQGGTAWSNANANIIVGSASSPPAAAASNTVSNFATPARSGMQSASFPSVASNVITFQSEFSTAVANMAWTELGVVNGSSGGTLLNRLVGNWGTKVNSATWVCTMTISLA